MTSASGANFAKGTDDGRGGVREVMIIFAVDVGDRCRVKACGCRALVDLGPVKEGLGNALT